MPSTPTPATVHAARKGAVKVRPSLLTVGADKMPQWKRDLLARKIGA